MDFKPQEIFIGLFDFFCILLPGAIASFILRDYAPVILGKSHPFDGMSVEAGWIVFLICSYLLGHFVFLIGSILDELLYDYIRRLPREKQIRRMVEGKNLQPKWIRFLAGKLIKASSDKALFIAVCIKNHYLGAIRATTAINTYQWCKIRLQNEHPELFSTVQRFEADAKFFRSLVVILVIFTVATLCKGDVSKGDYLLHPASEQLIGNKVMISIFDLILILLAFWRYIDRRQKAVTQAYWSVITTEACKLPDEKLPDEKPGTPLTHAGGVVYKVDGGIPQFLLVKATKNQEEWVLPKGHIEPGEKCAETAVREVKEETGIWAAIRKEMVRETFRNSTGAHIVQFYIMEFVEQGKSDEKRETAWFSYKEAVERASYNDTKQLLESANNLIKVL